MLFFNSNENNFFISQKKLAIFESLQLMLIAVKFSVPALINWNYALIFFMATAIYLTVLGLLLTIILSCSLFGFLYRGLESWKIKSLFWMTWYYLFGGLTTIYLIKGVIEFYDDENIITREQTKSYLDFKSSYPEILVTSGFMLLILNSANLLVHLLWEEDIKKYLTKVIYKNEIRKEISLRFLTKDFSFKVIQYSSVFFKKETEQSKEEQSKAFQSKTETVQEETTSQELVGQFIPEPANAECIVCFDASPNIVQDPCGHGGICRECALEYMKTEEKCMVCREKISRLYLIEYNTKEQCFYAKGEINLQL
jgi:hypothetical protein